MIKKLHTRSLDIVFNQPAGHEGVIKVVKITIQV